MCGSLHMKQRAAYVIRRDIGVASGKRIMEIKVVAGDVAQIEADAIVVNPKESGYILKEQPA